jgi:hypothetical protein
MKESNDPNESDNSNLYGIVVVLALILVGVAYVRIPSFREIADAKAPWFRSLVGHYLVSDEPSGGPGGNPRGSGGDGPAEDAGKPKVFNLAIFSAHPERWPRSIAIKVETKFPAVINDKVVGSVRAPAGSEVHLKKVENGKLGVEYRGGGAWVAPEATDLIERVQASPVQASPPSRP